MQLGEPETLPRLFDKREALPQGRLGACPIACDQQDVGQLRYQNGICRVPAGTVLGLDRTAERLDIFLCRITHGAGGSKVDAAQ